MVWTQPMTFTAGAALTAAQLNVHLRDNLLASETAMITEAQDYVISNGYHRLATRQAAHDFVATGQSTTSTEYVDLATVGPSVTVETTNRAWVILTSAISCTTIIDAYMSYQISGGTDEALAATQLGEADAGESREREPGDHFALSRDGTNSNTGWRSSYVDVLTAALVPGMNTFTAKYRVGEGGTATFTNRSIIVIPM